MGSRRICFVASDLLGLITNSGIGTATSYGAIVLAAAGHDVTLVHTRYGSPIDERWAERYAIAGVAVEAVAPYIVAPGALAGPYLVYRHLKDREFDAVVFQDWLGLGWACMEAKRCGLAFRRTQLVHICHGPEAWLHEANLQVGVVPDDLAVAHAGQRSAELADTVLGPSAYLIDWMASAGWQLPERRFVVPYFTEGHARAALGDEGPPGGAPGAGTMGDPALREIAFFGRLERRKGVQVYAAALNRVDPALLDGVTLSFLGREATFKRHEVLRMLGGPVRRAVAGVDFHTDLDNEAACRHLGRPGTMAVIASLVDNSPNTIYECLERGIPFLATATGGTPELLHDADRERCLVAANPAAMAAGLDRILRAGRPPEPARPAFDAASSLQAWDELLAWEPPPPQVEVREQPLVTVVLTHHDRPALVTTAVEALDAQDYPNLEIVVVDDGSVLPESHHVLADIESRRWRHDLRVLRQENRYLGAARNAGAAAARGDLVAFADDDDVAVPHFVSTLARAMAASGADAVTCAMTSFTRPLGAPEEEDSRGTWVFLGGPFHLAAVQNCLGGAAAMIRRPVLQGVGGYHERHGLGYEDWHLYVRLLAAGYTLVAVPEPVYWYRLQDTSMRHTMSDYHSVQVVLDEYRRAVPPALRPLVTLAHGQGVVAREEAAKIHDEIELRNRLLWLAEERLERLPEPPPADTGDGPAEPAGGTDAVRTAADAVRRGLVARGQRLREASKGWVTRGDRRG